MTVPTARELVQLDWKTIEEASAGPWAWSGDQAEIVVRAASAPDPLGLGVARLGGGEQDVKNAQFIAASRTGWPAALDEARRLSGVVKIVCNELETLINQILVGEVHEHKPVSTEVEVAITMLRLAHKAVENY